MSEVPWGPILALVGTVVTTAGAIFIARMQRSLRSIGADAAEARAASQQLRPNGGSSVADQVSQTHTGMRRLEERVAQVADEVTLARREALQDRRRLDALAGRVDEGLAEHVTFRSALDQLLHPRRRRRL